MVFDIVIWGATGFTGTQVAEHFARNAPNNVKWAIAGRSAERLASLKKTLVKIDQKNEDVGVLIGNSDNQESVDAVVRQARVVLSCAGPFALYGTPVVSACARLGKHYCDLTGETPWIKHVADRFQDAARESGAIIVNCCGFDSIPNDIGVFVATDYVLQKYGCKCDSVKSCMLYFSGGVSGGSIASLCNIFKTLSASERQAMRSPYYLVTSSNTSALRPQPRSSLYPVYDNELKKWTIPSVFSNGEHRFVLRSQSLMNFKYGNFQYSVVSASKSFLFAALASFLLLTVVLLASNRFGRWLLTTIRPPGSGPSRESLTKGGFSAVAAARPTAKAGVPPVVYGRVTGRGDPGYYLTAIMLSECGLCLATQADKIPAQQGGIYTPSSSMGTILVERLRNAGFDVVVTENLL